MMDILERLKYLVKPGNCEADMSVIDSMEDAIQEIERLRLAKLPDWAQAALTSSSAQISIVGNTPTTGEKLTADDYSKWLATIPEPIEPLNG